MPGACGGERKARSHLITTELQYNTTTTTATTKRNLDYQGKENQGLSRSCPGFLLNGWMWRHLERVFDLVRALEMDREGADWRRKL